jgi:hypothetical protein
MEKYISPKNYGTINIDNIDSKILDINLKE